MGPVGLGIAAVALSAGAAGYGVYAGERARSEAARQYQDAKNNAAQQRTQDQQQLAQNNKAQQDLYDKQVADQKATDDSLRTQQDAALAKAKGEVPGMQAQLGDDLLAQEQHAYTKMQPQMEARLNALGLLQSGALPEAQAKYQSDLESQRQAALSQFGANAAQQLNITQPLANSSADVGRQYDALHQNLSTQQNNLSQTFANQNAYNQNQVAQQQYLAGLGAANNSAAQASANSYLNFGGQLGSGLLNYYGSTYKQPQQQFGSPSLDALNQARGGWSNSSGGYQYA